MNIIKLFTILFNTRIRISRTRFVKALHFFYYDEEYVTIRNNITNIKVYIDKGIYLVEIITYRPGLVIGKHGNLIKETQEYLTNAIGEEVNIGLIENKMWYEWISKNLQ